MTNNSILRRLRFALDLEDGALLDYVARGGQTIDPDTLHWLMAREDDEAFEPCSDAVLRAFLDGLIEARRGPRDPATPARREGPLDNNLILRKLRIALELKEADMLALLERGGMELSPSELSALFRNPSNKHYRVCGDQLLRNFISGLTTELRGV